MLCAADIVHGAMYAAGCIGSPDNALLSTIRCSVHASDHVMDGSGVSLKQRHS
jgi:hypothetical protein